ncbi:MAG: ATP-binding cassette domain-containing protein [Sphaerochaetaceae bacterium]
MSDPILRFDGVTVRRGDFLLDHISFSVENQEMFAIIGRTGAGKTLLLEAAAGFYRPEAGSVLYRGSPVLDVPLYRRNIGYLYQEYCLFPHMTAEENIGYPLRMRHEDKQAVKENVRDIAFRFGVDGVLSQYPGTLSGGEQQRVALARALLMHPPLLLLDEPFSALDPVTKKRMYRMIRKVRKTYACAVLFVTHDFEEARLLADHIGVMIGGRLKGVVTPTHLFDHNWDEETHAFLGSTCANGGNDDDA